MPLSNQTAEIFLGAHDFWSVGYKNRLRQIFNAHLFYALPKTQKLKIDHRSEGNFREIITPEQKIKIFEAAKNKGGKVRLILQILHQCAPRGSEIVLLKQKHLEV